jgi:iron(III) transport system permease protein
MAEPAAAATPQRALRARSTGAAALLYVLSALLVLPLAAVVALALGSGFETWRHLAGTVLPDYLVTTFKLLLGVGVSTFVIGVGTAWLVSSFRFPFDTTLGWVLIAPLAMPLYIVAFVYVDLLEYAGPVQTALRHAFGWKTPADYWFPDIRSAGGAAIVMSLVLYPYVYALARASFARQSPTQIEVARTLGRSNWGAFRAVALPLARPAIVVGVSLALMECLNDIGAVDFFGVRTLALGVYTTWLGRGDLGAAAQIALMLLAVSAMLLWLERSARRGGVTSSARIKQEPPARKRLTGLAAWAATAACATPILLGLALPAAWLISAALRRLDSDLGVRFLEAAATSVGLSAAAAAITAAVALALVYAKRRVRHWTGDAAAGLAGMGYAMPGTVLGIGIIVPLSIVDNGIGHYAREHFGLDIRLLLTGSVFAVLLGYSLRFLTISFGGIDAGRERITQNLTAAARTLGRTEGEVFREVHLPLLRPAIVSVLLLVFVDCMKELPATLILRPFGLNTLATMVFENVTLGQLEDSAPAALAIVLVGLIPIRLLARNIGATVGNFRS